MQKLLDYYKALKSGMQLVRDAALKSEVGYDVIWRGVLSNDPNRVWSWLSIASSLHLGIGSYRAMSLGKGTGLALGIEPCFGLTVNVVLPWETGEDESRYYMCLGMGAVVEGPTWSSPWRDPGTRTGSMPWANSTPRHFISISEAKKGKNKHGRHLLLFLRSGQTKHTTTMLRVWSIHVTRSSFKALRFSGTRFPQKPARTKNPS